MAMTVRRLTQETDLGLALVAGSEGADRVIQGAHSIELADPAAWLSGGELVMTTGMQIGATAEQQFAYVAGLVKAGAVALAFDTGTTFSNVPDGIREAGERLAFPILAVPASTPFIAVTRAVIDELTADQLRDVQRVAGQQERLARATLRGGVPAVVATLGRALAATVAVTDSDGHALAVHGPEAERVIRALKSVTVARQPRPVRPRHTSTVLADDDMHYVVQSVATAKERLGYFAVGSPVPLSSAANRLLIAHAVSLVSIELGKPARVVDAEQRLRVVVTRALVDSGNRMDPGILRYFGFDAATRVVVVVLTDVGPLLPAERQVAALLTDEGIPYLMTPTKDGLVVIVAAEDSREPVEQLHKHLTAQLEIDIATGRGPAVPLTEVHGTVGHARAAARFARANPGQVTDYVDLGTFSLLLGSLQEEELRVLEHSMLGAVDAYDAERAAGSSLSATLATFLRHNGQIEAAAADLGIHRHTIRNHLRKITDPTGRDLASAQVRAELWFAVEARELRRARQARTS